MPEFEPIEKYVKEEFLPQFFKGVEKNSFIRTSSRHESNFEFDDKYYTFSILLLGNEYSAYLSNYKVPDSQIAFGNADKLEDVFLLVNKKMKHYRLSKIYDK
jgi:hypothetical protein